MVLLVMHAPSAGAAEQAITLPAATGGPDPEATFYRYYEPVRYSVTPSAPSYRLPLRAGELRNYESARNLLQSPAAAGLLEKNGFVTMPWTRTDDVKSAYASIEKSGLPVFITADSLLHLYHVQFDETLKRIEEKELYPDMVLLSRALRDELLARSRSCEGDVREAYLRGAAFFGVGLQLLDPAGQAPPEVRERVSWELGKIEAHAGFPAAPDAERHSVFTYMEDYSQYVPRGHYTQSDSLKRYFKAMMWYGRMAMLIRGDSDYGPLSKHALVSVREAKIQTILAAAVSGLVCELQAGGRSLETIWDRIYAITAFYSGFADDLTIHDYQDALRSVVGPRFRPGDFENQATFEKFQAAIAKKRAPAIYSGTGQSGVNLDTEEGGAMAPSQLIGTLEKTQGLRFMGQRYVPDSFILGRLVSPTVGKKLGSPSFTTGCIPDVGCVRVLPRGLDVMAVLGSGRSLDLLGMLGDSSYERYGETISGLKQQFGAISQRQWNRNLYWSWLYCLKALADGQAGEGWPTFSLSDAWRDRQLFSALGSWSSLRHDTILYAKQSFTMTMARAAPPPAKQAPGYVEPAPELYARLIALNRMTIRGLEDQHVLDADSRGRAQALDDALCRLLAISTGELEGRRLSPDEEEFIRHFAERVSEIVAGAGTAARKTTMAADVHTDQNTGSVLEEATGYLRLMLVAFKEPEGAVIVGAGPVYSYYEFKQPMADRLTDEKWRAMLDSGAAPEMPEWAASFGVAEIAGQAGP